MKAEEDGEALAHKTERPGTAVAVLVGVNSDLLKRRVDRKERKFGVGDKIKCGNGG